MAALLNKFDILRFASDLLFVEDTDFYPHQIWKDFEEALFLFLTDEEISLLSYSYGKHDYCRFSISERRKILSGLFTRLRNSNLFAEMDSLMSEYETDFLIAGFKDDSAYESNDRQEFVRSVLSNLGLPYLPETLGDLSFDSKIGNYPVYVWKFREVSMPLSVLNEILNSAADSGFGRFFVVASPRLTQKLPTTIKGCIPFTFIPLIEESVERGFEFPTHV